MLVEHRRFREEEDWDMDDEHGELIYEPLVYVDRRTTERDLRSPDAHVVANALLAASLEDEGPGWVFAQCLAMTDDSRVDVRWPVALAIGHLARPRRFVDEAPARTALQALAIDPAVQPAVLDALDDLEVALRGGRDEE